MTYRTTEPWIQTFTGKRFDLLYPALDSICKEDIAHALSMLCRFTGHAREFYSVAQHSVLAAREARARGWMGSVPLAALLHDASEAYLGDVSSPLKHLLPEYRQIESLVARAIEAAFDLDEGATEAPEVKAIDLSLLEAERALFLPERGLWKIEAEPLHVMVYPWLHDDLEPAFLEELYRCQNSRLPKKT